MFNKWNQSLISAAKITLFIGITRRYGCFYMFLVKFGRQEGRNSDGSWHMWLGDGIYDTEHIQEQIDRKRKKTDDNGIEENEKVNWLEWNKDVGIGI